METPWSVAPNAFASTETSVGIGVLPTRTRSR
jgi:hypothetical protein